MGNDAQEDKARQQNTRERQSSTQQNCQKHFFSNLAATVNQQHSFQVMLLPTERPGGWAEWHLQIKTEQLKQLNQLKHRNSQ